MDMLRCHVAGTNHVTLCCKKCYTVDNPPPADVKVLEAYVIDPVEGDVCEFCGHDPRPDLNA